MDSKNEAPMDRRPTNRQALLAERLRTYPFRAFFKTANPYVARAALKGDRALAQMSDDLRCFAAVNNGCATETDMETLGWTPEQIAKLGPVASRTARAQAAGRAS